jgi:hypothetical protein
VAFPADPLDVVTELLVDGRWRDISGDVREADGISINRGSASEDRTVPPARCSLTLADHDHRYNVRNPLSANYGLLGRNTPMRLSLRQELDDFEGRTVASGWGTSAGGYAWSTFSGSAANYAVSGGLGTQTVTSTNSFRLAYQAGQVHRDVDLMTIVQLSTSNVTAAPVEPANVVLRGVSTSDYYMVRLEISQFESVSVKLLHTDGTDYSGTVDVPVLYSGQLLAVRTQIEGQQWRAKVWAVDTASDPDSIGEPYDWLVSARIPDEPRAGWVGVRSGVATGNTNVPVTFSYSTFEVRSPRMAGEVSSWPPRTDTSENDRYVPIEASGVLRRLGQGQAPLHSVLRRSIPALQNLVAYWPCEDGRDAEFIASALDGTQPMTISGDTRMGAFDDFAASDPIPTVGAAVWTGRVPGYTGTGAVQLRWLMAVPAAGVPSDALVARLQTTGSVGFADLYVTPTGALRLFLVAGGSIVLDTGAVVFDANGKLLRVSIELAQNSTAVDWALSTLEVGSTTGGGISGTVANQSLSAATEVSISLLGPLNQTAIGHITVESARTSFFALADQLRAYAGETATDRMARLCAEEGVEFGITGDPDTAALMGPQRPDELLSLLGECAVVDQGVLGEFRGTAGLRYRTRQSFYNQTPVCTIDHDASELAPPFAPTDDDLATRNDVTVKRPEGASARAVLETGRMSVLDPAEGGAGRYTTSRDAVVYEDSQLQYLADWLLALGTIDSQRYPTVTLDLASIAGNATLFRGALSLDCGDQADIVNLSALGIYDDVPLVVLGYSENLGGYRHRLALNCTPAGSYRVLVWDSTTHGRLDSGSSTLAGALTSSATSFSVATADDELWTTNPAHFPLTVAIGGERIEISAISGATSPQTFTVASGGRAANGVTKAHDAGAEVHIADRNRYPL